MLPARRWGDERRWRRGDRQASKSSRARPNGAARAGGHKGWGKTHASTSSMVWSRPIPTGFNGGRSVVRLLPLALGLAAAQSRDELYAKCRRAVFRRYGQPGVQYNRAPGRRVLPSKFVVGAIDQCVASDGRVI